MEDKFILITGANGFVGSHLCGALATKGYSILAFVRKKSNLTEHQKVLKLYSFNPDFVNYQPVDTFEDVVDFIAEFEGNIVIHTAGFVSFTQKKYPPYQNLNEQGTGELAEQCLVHHKKLVHFSSIAALGDTFSETEKINETTLWQVEKNHSLYAISKMRGQMSVESAVKEGLKCAILNPGIILDPDPVFVSGSNQLIHKIFAKHRPYCPNKGTISWVSIPQIIQAVERIIKENIWLGEKYILVNETKDYLSFVSELKGVKRAKVRFVHQKTMERIRKMNLVLRWIGVKTISKDLIRSIFSESHYDTSLSEKRLGFDPIGVQQFRNWIGINSHKINP